MDRGFKTINETFTTQEFRQLTDKRGEMTWRDFILSTLEQPDRMEKHGETAKCPICNEETYQDNLSYQLEEFTMSYPETIQYFKDKLNR